MSDTEIELVRKMAELARLDIREDEARELALQFERILEHFEVLTEIDVAGVKATTGGARMSDVRGSDVRRADEPRPCLTPDEALGNAPERVDDFYRVPKTVGGAE